MVVDTTARLECFRSERRVRIRSQTTTPYPVRGTAYSHTKGPCPRDFSSVSSSSSSNAQLASPPPTPTSVSFAISAAKSSGSSSAPSVMVSNRSLRFEADWSLVSSLPSAAAKPVKTWRAQLRISVSPREHLRRAWGGVDKALGLPEGEKPSQGTFVLP